MKTFRKAQGMQVATIAEGAIVGKLDDFQFDLETGRIYGWRLKGPGVFPRSGGVPASALVHIGRDLVLVKSEVAIEWAGGARNQEEGRAWASEYRGTTVMTRRGATLGAVEDYLIEADPPQVRAMLVGGQHAVPFDPRVATGKDAVILEEDSLLQAVPEETGDSDTDWRTRLRGLFEATPERR